MSKVLLATSGSTSLLGNEAELLRRTRTRPGTDTHASPGELRDRRVGNYVIANPSNLGNFMIADTWDRGKELSAHAQFKVETGIADLLRRPALTLAARHQREHQRPAAPVLPERHRPISLGPRRPPRRPGGGQQQTPEKSSPGRRQPKSLTSSYSRSTKPVLQPPIEPRQYRSEAFAEAAAQLDIRQSVGRVGSCFDNALAESFNATLKVERVNRTAYPTREHARKDVARYIWSHYNTKRLHSALGYPNPREAYNEYQNQRQAA